MAGSRYQGNRIIASIQLKSESVNCRKTRNRQIFFQDRPFCHGPAYQAAHCQCRQGTGGNQTASLVDGTGQQHRSCRHQGSHPDQDSVGGCQSEGLAASPIDGSQRVTQLRPRREGPIQGKFPGGAGFLSGTGPKLTLRTPRAVQALYLLRGDPVAFCQPGQNVPAKSPLPDSHQRHQIRIGSQHPCRPDFLLPGIPNRLQLSRPITAQALQLSGENLCAVRHRPLGESHSAFVESQIGQFRAARQPLADLLRRQALGELPHIRAGSHQFPQAVPFRLAELPPFKKVTAFPEHGPGDAMLHLIGSGLGFQAVGKGRGKALGIDFVKQCQQLSQIFARPLAEVNGVLPLSQRLLNPRVFLRG